MKREQQHTPTPWELDAMSWPLIINGPSEGDADVIAMVDCEPNSQRAFHYRHDTAHANAQYIITAVNSHEKLIEALQSAIKWMDFVHEKLGDADQLAANVKKYGAAKYLKQFGDGAGYRASEGRAALASAEAGAVAGEAVSDGDAYDRETEELNAYDYRNEQEAERG